MVCDLQVVPHFIFISNIIIAIGGSYSLISRKLFCSSDREIELGKNRGELYFCIKTATINIADCITMCSFTGEVACAYKTFICSLIIYTEFILLGLLTGSVFIFQILNISGPGRTGKIVLPWINWLQSEFLFER